MPQKNQKTKNKKMLIEKSSEWLKNFFSANMFMRFLIRSRPFYLCTYTYSLGSMYYLFLVLCDWSTEYKSVGYEGEVSQQNSN